ncbi:MAG: L,D-transpeptidase family protein, partial [Ferruginibacter sp.]
MKRVKPKLIFFFVLCISCNSNSGQNSQSRKDSTFTSSAINTIAGNFSDQQTVKFEPEKIATFFIKYPLLNDVKKEIDSFYYNRQYACAWFDEKGMIEQAGNLYNHIADLDNEGVKDKLPYQKEFATMMVDENKDSLDVDTEIMLTAQYFVYAKQAWTGLNEKQTQSLDWYLPRKKIAYNLLLDSFILGKDVLNSPPIYRQYYLLKNQLKKYRSINTAGGFPVIADIKKSLKKGDSSSIIIDIQKWLIISGDLNAGIPAPIFNDSLEAAVKRFQQRFGLKMDGVIGAAFIKEINVPAEKRMQQIMVNMERSRWVPVTVSTDYLVLNIPEFKLHAYEHDSLLWSMDAVVGKPVHKTVIFSGKIKYIVFSPYWNVPNSILQHEVLPGIRRNKNYLANQHMEWNGGQVRQKPGPDNALGLVKFLFPNSYNIYLHDTPAKSLFSESSRAFSHGCIRLSNAEE